MGRILFYNLKTVFLYTLVIKETTFHKEFHHFQDRLFFQGVFSLHSGTINFHFQSTVFSIYRGLKKISELCKQKNPSYLMFFTNFLLIGKNPLTDSLLKPGDSFYLIVFQV